LHRGITLALATCLLAAPASAQEPSLDFLDVPERPHRPGRAPSAEAARGLVELEGELTRFGRAMRSYRSTVDSLLERRARERRRAILSRYASSIAAERLEEGRSRSDAIAHLERFVQRHPDEVRHTPSALLRLAELYVEQAYDAPGDELALAPVIRATRQIVLRFSSSPLRDQAAYLLGWSLAEQGDPRQALQVWRSVVCPDRFAYPAPAAPRPAPPDPVEAHPALASPQAPPRPRGVYEGCQPTPSPLAAEIWLRMGEEHFDAAELDAAIEAYRRVVERPDDRLFAFGLYKLAWSQYRAGRYPEAIERFGEVIQYADDARDRGDEPRVDLRAEALQYVALTLAYDDWNEDGQPDHAQGGPHPLERLEDPSLWPHDRAWSPEVYRRVGDLLFEQALPDEAVVAWRLRLGSYAPACDTPDVYLAIIRAQRQLGDEDAALGALEELATHVAADSEWRTRSCPGRADRAEQIARSALASAARIHHRRAQRLRQRDHVDAGGGGQAAHEYGRAIDTYRAFLARYPAGPEAYEIAYDLADALFWSGRFEEAARAYADVRDSPLDDRRFAAAARRVVESERRRLQEAVERGDVVERAHPAPAARAVPAPLRRLARAREIYVRWVRPAEDVEHVRDAYAFNNALMLSRYGWSDEARRRWARLVRDRCRGPAASAIGLQALDALLDDAARREDAAQIEALVARTRARRCTFSPEGPALLPSEGDDCAGEACRGVLELEVSARLRRLRDAATALRDAPEGPGRRRRAERLAAELIAIADREPEHADAPVALLLAGQLLDQDARRPRSGARVYRRIVDTVTLPDDAAPQLEHVIAEAHFQLARAAQRSFDYEQALASYATIVDSERFARSDDAVMRQRRRDALVNTALLSARLGRHADAARAWTRAAEVLGAVEAREARLHAASATLDAGDSAGAARQLDAWLREGPATVRAWSLRARAAEAAGDDDARVRALRAVLRTHARATRRADAPTAARAALALADHARDGAPLGVIAPGRRATLDAWVRELGRQIDATSARVASVAADYDRVVDLGHAADSVVALHRQGSLYEALVRAVLGARFELPQDTRRQLRRASARTREDVRARIEDRVRETLDAQVRPVECRAVERYTLAVRLARRASLPTPEATRARERLAAYGAERVRECLAAAHARDPSFGPWVAGELDAARSGRHRTPPTPVAPSVLAE